jgi:cytochrome c-type biogenesis protein CcmH
VTAVRRLILAALFAAFALPGLAVQPDEMLDDPALETRAREISKELRCLVCRNESIDDSNASLARDLRLLVRERLLAGDSDTQVKAYLVDRYGEFVLLRPTFSGGNAILWFGGPALLLIGGLLAFQFIQKSRRAPEAARPDAPLSPEEKARIDALLRD